MTRSRVGARDDTSVGARDDTLVGARDDIHFLSSCRTVVLNVMPDLIRHLVRGGIAGQARNDETLNQVQGDQGDQGDFVGKTGLKLPANHLLRQGGPQRPPTKVPSAASTWIAVEYKRL